MDSADIKGWLASAGRTQAWLARQLGVSRQYLCRVVAGQRPGPRYAFEIERLSGGRVTARALLLGDGRTGEEVTDGQF